MYKLIAPAVAAAVIAPTGLALAAGPPAQTAHAAAVGGTQRLSFFAPEVQQKLLDLGDPGFSLGDELIFTDNVLTRKNGPQVGTDGGVCTVIRVTDASALAGTLECQVTFSLPGAKSPRKISSRPRTCSSRTRSRTRSPVGQDASAACAAKTQ